LKALPETPHVDPAVFHRHFCAGMLGREKAYKQAVDTVIWEHVAKAQYPCMAG